jgi:hypothetical protein
MARRLLGSQGVWDACRSLLFPKDGCARLIGLPTEEIISTRPCVDLDPANLAIETAGTLVRMLFLGRSVRHPAIGAVETFGCPYAACHRANLPCQSPFFSLSGRRDRTARYAIPKDRQWASLAGKPVRSVNRAVNENLHQHPTAARSGLFFGFGIAVGALSTESAIELPSVHGQ